MATTRSPQSLAPIPRLFSWMFASGTRADSMLREQLRAGGPSLLCCLPVNEPGFSWLGERTSRAPAAQERSGARVPYRAPAAPPVEAEPDDELLGDEEQRSASAAWAAPVI